MFADGSTDDPTHPIAIIGPQNNNRIIAQKGVFTIFPQKEIIKMEEIHNCNEFLIKFNIEEQHVVNIAKQLYNLGVTESSLYPELDSVAREIVNHI